MFLDGSIVAITGRGGRYANARPRSAKADHSKDIRSTSLLPNSSNLLIIKHNGFGKSSVVDKKWHHSWVGVWTG